MIFVILGLAILFISFIVALVSLLREQREVGERSLEDRGLFQEPPHEEVSRPVEQVNQPDEESQELVPPAKQAEPKEQVIPEAQIEEAFPWEKEKSEFVSGQGSRPTQTEEENLSKDQEHSPKSHLEGVIVIPRKGGV